MSGSGGVVGMNGGGVSDSQTALSQVQQQQVVSGQQFHSGGAGNASMVAAGSGPAAGMAMQQGSHEFNQVNDAHIDMIIICFH